ncbi:hypothetical protein CKA34_16170 [Rhizobium sp. 11515TR]|nr:hypothetical protein CKA34_16170 [Rhizobium sp. 11515TR]
MPPDFGGIFVRLMKSFRLPLLTFLAFKTKCASAFTFRPPRERALRDNLYAREGQKRFNE